jgi:SPP1 family predicted phage head-tail adaptor
MRAGVLNEVIVILRPVIVKDEFGAERVVYEDYKRARAQVKYNSGNRIAESHEIITSSNVTFTIRNQYDIDEKMRVCYDKNEYLILSINRERHRQSITIITELVNE